VFKINHLATICASALLLMSTSAASAQDRRDQNTQGHTQFDDKDRQTTNEWFNQHKDRPPVGFRNQDRLSADQESRLREGAVLDKDLRKKVHPVPEDLGRRLPPPPRDHRYVAIGGHVGLIDNHFQVKAVIHLH
jgi:Ni/Co efflux regulator RcnB